MTAAALDGTLAVVTGAGAGLGRGFALALADAGAEVALVGRTAATLEALADEIAAGGGRARSLPCDVTDGAAFAQALATLERVDVLVNNAGTNHPEPFLEVTPERFDAIFALNVRAAYFAAQAAARRMVADGGGTIVNVSSQMGHVGAANRSVYCASKHALEGLTRALAVELAPHGVRVCSLAPTYVRTPMTAPFFEDAAFLADSEARIPLGRIAEIDDVAPALVFLCSPAARFVTGTSLRVDGGYTAQ